MNNKQNQTFTSLDVVMVLSLVIAVLSCGGAVLASVALDSATVQAKLQAEKLANQILLGGLDTYKSEAGKRLPSAISPRERMELLGNSGTLSRDPWGRPYFYQISTDRRGRKVAVVWSGGPNLKVDTELQLDDRGNLLQVQFAEDDLGVVVSQ